MNLKSDFCKYYDCNYDKYYKTQAGGGNDFDEISFYTGKPYQRGHIFTKFGQKYAIPLLKYLGLKTWNYGKNVFRDIVSGKDPKTSFKRNLKGTIVDTLDDIKTHINQTGTNRRKRKRKSKSKTMYKLKQGKNKQYKRKRKAKKNHSKVKTKRKSTKRKIKGKRKRIKNKTIFD